MKVIIEVPSIADGKEYISLKASHANSFGMRKPPPYQ